MLAKLARGNLLRVLREAEQAAARLQKARGRLLPDDRAARRRTAAAGQVLRLSGRGRERVLHEAEQLAAGARRPGRPGVRPRAAATSRASSARSAAGYSAANSASAASPAVHQPVAPAFRAAEARRVQARGVRPGVERGPDRARGRCRASAWRRTAAGGRGRRRLVIRRASATASASFSGRSRPSTSSAGASIRRSARSCTAMGLALQFTLGRRRDAAGQLAAAHSEMLARAPLQAPGRRYNPRGPMAPATQPDQKALEQVVERALALARAGGATAAEAGVGVSTGLSVTVRLGEVETLEYQRDRSLGVTVYAGQRKGSASTANLTPAAVEETIAQGTLDRELHGRRRVRRAARCRADGGPAAGPRPEPSLGARGAGSRRARAGAARPRASHSTRASAIPRAPRSRRTASCSVFGNSHGFIGGYPSTSHSVSCVVLGQDDGDMQRDYWYTAARDWRALEDVESVGRKAAEKAVQRLGAGKLSTRKAPVLFAPELARGLIGHFTGAIGGARAVPPQQLPARREGRAGLPGSDLADRAAAPARRARLGAVRRRGRRDARP